MDVRTICRQHILAPHMTPGAYSLAAPRALNLSARQSSSKTVRTERTLQPSQVQARTNITNKSVRIMCTPVVAGG